MASERHDLSTPALISAYCCKGSQNFGVGFLGMCGGGRGGISEPNHYTKSPQQYRGFYWWWVFRNILKQMMACDPNSRHWQSTPFHREPKAKKVDAADTTSHRPLGKEENVDRSFNMLKWKWNLNRILITEVTGVKRMMLAAVVVNFSDCTTELIYIFNFVMKNNTIKYMGPSWF